MVPLPPDVVYQVRTLGTPVALSIRLSARSGAEDVNWQYSLSCVIGAGGLANIFALTIPGTEGHTPRVATTVYTPLLTPNTAGLISGLAPNAEKELGPFQLKTLPAVPDAHKCNVKPSQGESAVTVGATGVGLTTTVVIALLKQPVGSV